MRTALEHPPTKEKLLEAAQCLMLAKGFAATTVDEICEQAGLTKGSFFHYFDSKDHLGDALLSRFCESSQKMHRGFCADEKDPLKRVYRYIDGAIALAKDPRMSQGCLLGVFAQEMSQSHPKMRSACKKGFEGWAGHFSAELAKAKAQYAPRAAFKPKELAEYLIAVMEGAMILGKARGDMRVMAKHLEHYKAYLRTLFGR